MRTLLVLLALVTALPAAVAQDALRRKRLYLDTSRLTGSGVSCVDCHGGLPGGAFGIGKAANSPDIIERAVNTIAPMAPFRGRLTAHDYADLAAFIGEPAQPSPDLRLTTTPPACGSASTSRIDFGVVSPGSSSAVGSVQFVNAGQIAMQLVGTPRLTGPDADDFLLISGDCASSQVLQAQQACRIDVAFRPRSGSGPRRAALQIEHDWVEGVAALALLGTADAIPAQAPAPIVGPGGGGALGLAVIVPGLLLLAIGAPRHPPRRRRDIRSDPH